MTEKYQHCEKGFAGQRRGRGLISQDERNAIEQSSEKPVRPPKKPDSEPAPEEKPDKKEDQ